MRLNSHTIIACYKNPTVAVCRDTFLQLQFFIVTVTKPKEGYKSPQITLLTHWCLGIHIAVLVPTMPYYNYSDKIWHFSTFSYFYLHKYFKIKRNFEQFKRKYIEICYDLGV